MYIPKRKRDLFTVTLNEGIKSVLGSPVGKRSVKGGPFQWTGVERDDNGRVAFIRAKDCSGKAVKFSVKTFDFNQVRKRTAAVVIPKSACPGC